MQLLLKLHRYRKAVIFLLKGKHFTLKLAKATGARFLSLERNVDVDQIMDKAWSMADENVPVIVDVKIDYSKRTRFTEGVVATNLKRFNLGTKARFISRALVRKVTG